MPREITVPAGSTVEIRRRRPAPKSRVYRTRPPRETPDTSIWRNDSGLTAPPYGILRVTGGTTVNGRDAYTCSQPSTTHSRLYMVNGPHEVEDGAYGQATLWRPGRALYDPSGLAPAYGEGWGPKPSSWLLWKNYYGFTIVGNADGNYVFCTSQPVDLLIGKTAASHAKGAMGTVNIWAGQKGGEVVITSMTVSAYNRYAPLASSVWVDLSWKGNGYDEVAAEC